jgi:hypothetical protein
MLNPPVSFKLFLSIIAIIILWFAEPVFAGLFKWVDDAGKTHYTDDKGKIPAKYRTKTHIKKLRALKDHSSKSEASKDAGPADATNEKGILSDQEEKSINKTIAFFKRENSRSAKYKGLQNLSPTYRKMSLEIEKNLPEKKKLIAELDKSKNAAVKEANEFLKKSVAADELRIKTVWQQGYIGGYFKRILGEIDVKNGLIGKLNSSLEESQKLKDAKAKAEKENAEKAKIEKEKVAKEDKKDKQTAK